MKPKRQSQEREVERRSSLSRSMKLALALLSFFFASFLGFNGLNAARQRDFSMIEYMSHNVFSPVPEDEIIPQDSEIQSWNVTQNGTRPLRVMLYYGYGASSASWEHIYEILKCEHNKGTISLVKIKSFKFFTRVPLDSPKIPDVLVVPGGGASSMASGMGGSKGARRVGAFIRHFMEKRGMGYLGICAGAFLASNHRRGLGLGMWPIRQSGGGVGSLSSMEYNRTAMSEIGAEEEDFPAVKGHPVFYANGPLFDVKPRHFPPGSPLGNPKALTRSSPGAKLLGPAIDRERIRSVRRDSAIAVYNEYGKGRVILMGPHPETIPKRHSPRLATECNSVWGKYLVGLIRLAGLVSLEENTKLGEGEVQVSNKTGLA